MAARSLKALCANEDGDNGDCNGSVSIVMWTETEGKEIELGVPYKHDEITRLSLSLERGGLSLVWIMEVHSAPSVSKRSPSEAGTKRVPPILIVRILPSRINL
jgi:hypothetical protein